ncbi:MAG: tripartite tricarboxylate transporter substrate binding protein [Pseudomonadota bacterium]
MHLHQLATSLFFTASLLATATAHAAFPDKPIRMVVPFVAGGSAGSAARELAQRMSVILGQNVFVDHLGGAGGNIGAAAVANAAPDGYTVLIASSGILTVNPSLYKKLPFDPAKLTPVGVVASYPLVIFANGQLPMKDLPSFISYARQYPGKLSFGSAGYGTSGHLFGELLKDAAKIDIVHVPYKGGGQAMMDVISGQISMMMEASVVGMGYTGDGRLRALAVTGRTRMASAPNIPTIAESGLPGFDAIGWYGLLTPPGTPRDVVARLNEALNAALSDGDTKTKLGTMGMDPVTGTPEALSTLIRSDAAKWSAVVQKTGIKLD